MGRFVHAGLAIAVTLLAACAMDGPPARPSRLPAGAGLIYLYVQPLPREADGLRADIDSVAAIAADGIEHSLVLESESLDATTARRQRLLALGPVPAGSYTGLAVRASRARLALAPTAVELPVSTAPAVSDARFVVTEGRATVLTLELRAAAAQTRDAAFQPTFAVGAASATSLAPAATAVATLSGNSVLVVFHKLSGEVFDVLRTAEGPSSVAYDADRARAYVACAGADAVEAFDLARGLRDQALPLIPGDQPAGLALTSDGRTLVVPNAGSNTVTVLDAPSLAERFRVGVGQEPVAAVLDAEERRALVFERGSGGVSVLDLARRAVVATVPTDPAPLFGALARGGRRLLVIHRDSSYLSVLDLLELRVVERAYVGPEAQAIAVDPRTGRTYLARRGSDAVEVYDPASLLPIETVATGDATFLLADREAEQFLAALPDTHSIQALRFSGGRVLAITELGGKAGWIDAARGARGGS